MELNAEQIKKALECCSGAGEGNCSQCPYDDIALCIKRRNDDIIALITSQERKIKELTEENERLRGERAKLFEYKHGTLVRNELVLTKNKKEFDEFCEAIKADTVRKMQERLKEHLEKPEFPWDSFTVAEEVIDQIAKEMLEGGE